MGKKVIETNTKWMGSGNEFVYVYSFSSCLEKKNRRRGMAKMKVGMTTQASAVGRVHQQIGTSNHEKAILLYVYRTNNATMFEKLLHIKLKEQNRKVEESVGTEWFWIKENEIIKMLKAADKKIPKPIVAQQNGSLYDKSNNGFSHGMISFGIIAGIIFLPKLTISLISLWIIFKMLEVIKIL